MISLKVFCFPNIIMYILNVVSAIQKMSIKELKKCVFENYHQQMRFAKEKSYYSMKHHKKRFTIACN